MNRASFIKRLWLLFIAAFIPSFLIKKAPAEIWIRSKQAEFMGLGHRVLTMEDFAELRRKCLQARHSYSKIILHPAQEKELQELIKKTKGKNDNR